MPKFCPFDYKNGSDDDYYSQYNAIKHDRVKNLNKATVYTLIRVLGALYILNLYFDNKKILLDDVYATKLDKSGGSNIFAYLVAPCKDVSLLDSQKDIALEECIYRIIREENGYAFIVKYIDKCDEIRSVTIIRGTKDFQQYAKSCKGIVINIDNVMALLYGEDKIFRERMKEKFLMDHKVKKIISVYAEKLKSIYRAELNKNNSEYDIY